MKNLLLLLFILSGSSFAFIIEDVTQESLLIPACPICDGGTLVTTTTFTFSNVSCSKTHESNFVVDIEEKSLGISGDKETFVTIKTNGPVADCAGPTRKYEYSVSTDKLKEGARYILTNPLVM